MLLRILQVVHATKCNILKLFYRQFSFYCSCELHHHLFHVMVDKLYSLFCKMRWIDLSIHELTNPSNTSIINVMATLFNDINQVLVSSGRFYTLSTSVLAIMSSPPGQNGRDFPDDIFKSNVMNKKFCISIQTSLNFVLKGPIYNFPTYIGSDNGLAPIRRQVIIWTNVDPVHWRIYAALGGDELIKDSPWYIRHFPGVCYQTKVNYKVIRRKKFLLCSRKCQDYVYVKWEYWRTM